MQNLLWYIPVEKTSHVLTLNGRYIISSIHQLRLRHETTRVTQWVESMRQSSLDGLLRSSKSTVRLIEDLLLHDGVRYLSISA